MTATFRGNTLKASIENSSRFYALQKVFEAQPIETILLGSGMAETSYYLPGYFGVYYSMGLIGLLLTLYMHIRLYIKGDNEQKVLMLCFAVLNIGSKISLGSFAIYYLPFIMVGLKERYKIGTY